MASKKNAGKSGGMPKSFLYALIFLIILPVTGLVGWYAMTVVMEVSGSSKSTEELLADKVQEAQEAVAERIKKRAEAENFNVDKFDSCTQIEDQYRLPTGFVYSELTKKQLLGLPVDATQAEMQERCVLFAKAVAKMETLAHHDRHVFVCQGAQFSADETGRFALLPDPQARGVIVKFDDAISLNPIPVGQQQLLQNWQVFNLGDGCLVIGMSKNGVFSMSGRVIVDN